MNLLSLLTILCSGLELAISKLIKRAFEALKALAGEDMCLSMSALR